MDDEDDERIFSDQKYYSIVQAFGHEGDGDSCDSLEELETQVELFMCRCFERNITDVEIFNFTSLNILESICGGFLSGKDLKDEEVDPEHFKTYISQDNSLNAFC